MNAASKKVQTIYLILLLFNTLAVSLIWGINTLFLLDAGLTNVEAFGANAFFTVGMLLFEIPTGVVADFRGRRLSYLLGTSTLAFSTFLYLVMWSWAAPFWGWAIASTLLGLGFTFFSGAVEAWLVDALAYHKFKGDLESVFAKGQMATGAAMLCGSVAGGYIAQISNLGVPYVLRAGILVITFVLAFLFMKDSGFTPAKSSRPMKAMKTIFQKSVTHGLKNAPVRWLMLASIFSGGIGIYAFYAMQPYLLELYGNSEAYGIAGLAAAIVAGAQIFGGLLVPVVRKILKKRTTALLIGAFLSAVCIVMIGLFPNFWLAIVLLVVWALMFATMIPIRQAFLNDLIPSEQRATVLSFDALMDSAGGVVFQPLLGRSADVWGYSFSYIVAGFISVLALPFVWLARREKKSADMMD